MRKIAIYLCLLFILTGISQSFSQISISAGLTVTQNFDTLGTAAVATLPMGWKADTVKSAPRTIKTYSAAGSLTIRSYGNNMSATAANGICNFGAGDPLIATDRAIGGISSGTGSKSVNVYCHLHNNGSLDISNFTVSYDVEKYRKGSNPSGFRIQMSYSPDGIVWTDAGADFLTFFPADADNTGYASAPGTTVNITNKTLNVNVPAGSDLYLVWNYSVAGTLLVTTNAQALGIDNVSITANGSGPVVPVPAKLVITDVNGGVSPVRNVPFSVTVEARDTADNPAAVTSNTLITLFLANGTGSLGGYLQATIPTDSNHVTINTVTYNVAETGVTLFPHDDNGYWTWDTCAPFDVNGPPAVARKLKVISVNNGLNPVIGSPFFVVVQSQDTSGVIANVTSDVVVNLTKITGSGILGGNLTCTIAAGTNRGEVLGILYDTPESGVSVMAADQASLLVSDTSDLFTVDSPYPGIASLPTSYEWTPSTSYPTGWYNSGLSSYTTGHLAANSGKFDNTDDNLIIHYNDTARYLRFFMKTNGVDSTYRFDVMESVNGLAFTVLATFTDTTNPLNGTYTKYVYTPSPDARFIKFIYTMKTRGNLAIDEVLVDKYPPVIRPFKLHITQVNNGNDPTVNIPFDVQVEAMDSLNNPVNAITEIPFTLFVAGGSGMLGGTFQGIIPALSNQVTITGVTYDIAESGVTLYPHDDGNALTRDTCAAFNVLALPIVAEKLVVLSVNGGVNPVDGMPFTLTVQTQDNAGNVANVNSDVIVDLSKLTGTGVLSGTLYDTIFAGTNQKMITGIVYDIPEPGVSIRVADRASVLTAGNSSLFTVDEHYPGVANIPTSYDWAPSTNFPTGWYMLGLNLNNTGHLAPNSGEFDTQGDKLVIHYNTSADSLKFWLKKNAVVNPGRFDILESTNGMTFTTIKSFSDTGDSLQVTYTEYQYSPSPASRYIQFEYTTQTSGTISIDEVSLFNSTIGITDKYDSPSLVIRPNPGKGLFYFNTSCAGNYSLEIYNILGARLFNASYAAPRQVIDLSGFENGMYMIRITEAASSRTYTSKLIIN